MSFRLLRYENQKFMVRESDPAVRLHFAGADCDKFDQVDAPAGGEPVIFSLTVEQIFDIRPTMLLDVCLVSPDALEVLAPLLNKCAERLGIPGPQLRSLRPGPKGQRVAWQLIERLYEELGEPDPTPEIAD